MTDQIGAAKPPTFNENVVEHLRQIADYLKAAGDRANATTPRDGSEQTEMVTFGHIEASLTQDEDDLDLDGSSVARIDLDADWDVTGILAGSGRWLMIINVSAHTLTLIDEATSTSAAANQMLLGSDLSLNQNGTAILWYDDVTEMWRKVSI